MTDTKLSEADDGKVKPDRKPLLTTRHEMLPGPIQECDCGEFRDWRVACPRCGVGWPTKRFATEDRPVNNITKPSGIWVDPDVELPSGEVIQKATERLRKAVERENRVGRPKTYASAAERQRAYRERKESGNAGGSENG